MKVEILSVVVLPMVLFAWLLCVVPFWTRAAFFSVTVSPEFRGSPEAKQIGRVYRIGVVLSSGILLAVAATWFALSPWASIAAVASQFSIAMVFFARAHAHAMPHRLAFSGVRVASLQSAEPGWPGGPAVLAAPYVILFGAAWFLFLHWAEIPLRFPIHFDFDGQPNGWAPRSGFAVFGPLLIGFGLVTLLEFIGWGIGHRGARRGATPESAAWLLQFQHATLQLLSGLILSLGAIFSYVALSPLLAEPWLVAAWPLFVLLIPIAVLAVRLLLLSRGVRRTPDGTPDEKWKWGVLYYNPSDPALFVERRYGIGYTVNMAHRVAWVVLACVVLLIGGTVLVAGKLQ